jgi:hypothetical protein
VAAALKADSDNDMPEKRASSDDRSFPKIANKNIKRNSK